MPSSKFDRVLRRIWCEPKFVARIKWLNEYSVNAQLHAQVPRAEMEAFVRGEGWVNPDRPISFVVHEEPDWNWWEPRYDQPWRRQQARDREFGL